MNQTSDHDCAFDSHLIKIFVCLQEYFFRRLCKVFHIFCETYPGYANRWFYSEAIILIVMDSNL